MKFQNLLLRLFPGMLLDMSSDENYYEGAKTGPFSVLISVYGKSDADFFSQALESIWTNQTLKPAQICIVKDGPLTIDLDNTIESWRKRYPSVITCVVIKENVGLGSALNIGLTSCRYPIIARMDADDVSLPNRFFVQYRYLLEHPEVDVVGSQVQERDDGLQKVLAVRQVPLEHSNIVKFAKLRSPFNHPSVMYRKESVMAVGGYPHLFPEDYPLWIKMLQAGANFANVNSILLIMRSEGAYRFRRGMTFFIREINVIFFLKKIGFLTWFELIKSIALRFIYRLTPPYIKIFIKSKC